MGKRKVSTKIPKSLYRYFWDVNIKTLDPEKEATFILSRLLDKGNKEAFRYVQQTFSPQQIRLALKIYKDFSLRSASFLATIYRVPLSQVKCFQEPYLTTRRTLWPY